jgi:hypothetical protein
MWTWKGFRCNNLDEISLWPNLGNLQQGTMEHDLGHGIAADQAI